MKLRQKYIVHGLSTVKHGVTEETLIALIQRGKSIEDLLNLGVLEDDFKYDVNSELPVLLDGKMDLTIESYFGSDMWYNTSGTQKGTLEAIADKLSTVRDWMEIPEETSAGINEILDDLNSLIKDMRS